MYQSTMADEFKQACINNSFDRIRSMFQKGEVNLQYKNNSLVKYCCTLPNAVPLLEVILELCPYINIHIDDDCIVKQACVKKHYPLITFLVQRYPDWKTWDDFHGVVERISKQWELLEYFLPLDPELINRNYIELLYNACENNKLEIVIRLFDQYRYDNMDKKIEWDDVFKFSMHEDLCMVQWLYENKFIVTNTYTARKLFRDFKYSISIRRWLLDHYSQYDIEFPSYNEELWYKILDTPEVIHNVTKNMLLDALRYLIIKPDVEAFDRLLVKYRHIAIDIDKLHYLTFCKFTNANYIKTEYIPMIRYLSMVSLKYRNSCRNYSAGTRNWAIKHGQLKKFMIWTPYKPTGSYHESITYKVDVVIPYPINIRNFIDDNPDEVIEKCSSYHIDDLLWLIHISSTSNKTVFNALINHLKTNVSPYNTRILAQEKRDMMCLICKQVHTIIELPCDHSFCLRSLIDLRVTSEIMDTCIKCNRHYDWKECVEYSPSMMGKLFEFITI